MRDERQHLSLQKVKKKNDLDAVLSIENNWHIGELVHAKDDFDRQKQRLERKLVHSKKHIVKERLMWYALAEEANRAVDNSNEIVFNENK